MTLIFTQTGEPVKVGDTVVSFRNEPAVVVGWREKPAPSSGRVTVKFTRTGEVAEFYPSVFDLHFAELRK